MSTMKMWQKFLDLPLLEKDEQQTLLQRAGAGDARARQKLVERNLRLVFRTCKPFYGACDHRVSFDDVLQAGAIALQRAIDKYDPARGALSTIAVTYIKRDVAELLAVNAASLSMPREVAVMYRVEYHRSGGSPSPERVAAVANISTTAATRVIQSRFPVYLDKPRTTGTDPDGRTAGERIADPLADDHAQDCCDAIERREKLASVLTGLRPRERKLLEMRFGIGRQRPATCREVAAELGIDEARVPALEQFILDRALASASVAA